MNSTQTEPNLDPDDMRLKLAAMGALAPSDFNELAWKHWQTQDGSSLESMLVNSGRICQEQWEYAATLRSEPESIFATQKNVDLGVRGLLVGNGVIDRAKFDLIYGEWTSRLGDQPEITLAEVAGILCVPAGKWEEAEAQLAEYRRNQADYAYRAGQLRIDAEIIIVAIESGVPMLKAIEMVEQGNATVAAANRHLLEEYLALYAPELWHRRPVVRRLIGKYDFEKLSQAQELPAFEDMVAKGIAIALVAGGDIVKIAADARAIININGGTAVFNSFVGRLLLDVLPELGCEGHEGTK